MTYFDPVDINLFNLGDLGTLQSRDVTDSIVAFSTSLTIGGSSEIKVSVIDPDFAFAKANYFQIRRDVFYRNLWFEISAVEVERSDAIHPLYNLDCRAKAVQLMKRDKKPEAYRGMSAFDFAQAIAKRFNLGFVGQKTTKKQAVVKGKSKDSDDSVWTVLQSLASEQQFICFESEGTLFFCSETFLLGKWGLNEFRFGDGKFIPFFYPETNDPYFISARDKWILLEQPTIRRSDDDIRAAEGSMLVDRLNGVNLRPGMTIYLGGIPDFESFYIITDVTFNEGTPEPVSVNFRVPLDPKKESISTKGTKQNTTSNGSTGVANPQVPLTGQTVAQQGIGTSPTAVKLSEANAARYASLALGQINYRGTNGNLIIDAVKKATARLINKVSLAEIEKLIKATAGLTSQEKQHAFNIYSHYALGFPMSSLGAAGGITTGVSDGRRDQLTDSFRPVQAVSTPTSATASANTASAPNAQSSTQLFGGTTTSQVLPGGVIRFIDEFLNTKKSEFTNTEFAVLRAQTIADARMLYRMPLTESRAEGLGDIYQTRTTPTKSPEMSVKMLKTKYNALRQERVYKLIDPLLREDMLIANNAPRFG